PWTALVERFAPRMRFPYLFLVLLGLFLMDLVIPDPIPLIDEALLGVLTVIVGSLRRRQPPVQRL
ncbi:MAG: hypothetical protein GY906_26610, partial [bacterium]|nr:hypothetical protein [bacterium]